MTTSSNKWQKVALISAGILITFLIVVNFLNRRKIKELEVQIANNDNISEEIKEKLIELINENETIDPQVSGELQKILKLYELKENPEAILKLAKIIENLLKRAYSNDPALKDLARNNGRKNPAFADYIQHALDLKVISKEDYHNLSVLKIIRNEEAHELNVQKSRGKILGAFFSGIGIALAISRFINNKHAD